MVAVLSREVSDVSDVSDVSEPGRRTRNVTVRDLSRNTRRLLDELEETDTSFVVLRYGRPAAIISTIPEGSLDERSGPDDLAELTAVQRMVLAAMCDGVPAEVVADRLPIAVTEALVAIAELELAGLVARDFGSYRVTRSGAAAARREGSPS